MVRLTNQHKQIPKQGISKTRPRIRVAALDSAKLKTIRFRRAVKGVEVHIWWRLAIRKSFPMAPTSSEACLVSLQSRSQCYRYI
ncbi:hypothetical protein L484_025034 [Morus notabilis]|uniref:Uncharacterized protein n=1 Tax=Morus notabilis TaxID=981085 RepID=W9QKJ6_9ROSA|nr:hypothetical protein L484_025034 [Morus notabilis]